MEYTAIALWYNSCEQLLSVYQHFFPSFFPIRPFILPSVNPHPKIRICMRTFNSSRTQIDAMLSVALLCDLYMLPQMLLMVMVMMMMMLMVRLMVASTYMIYFLF